MKYRVVISDYDGTLLRSDDTISKRTLKTLKKFRDNGGIFLIATGRMHSGIKSQMPKIGMDKINIPLISYQGALVKYSLSDEILHEASLPFKDASEVLRYGEERGIYCHTYFDDTLYIREATDFSNKYAKYLNVEYKIVNSPLSEFLLKMQKPVHKVLFFVDKIKRVGLENDLRASFGERMFFHSPSSQMIDANNFKAGKDNAVEVVGEKLGFKMSDCMIFGDNYNDFGMVQKAGLGIAVENAVEDLKKVAKYITKSNNQDGVAEAIEKFCF